jgi:hypothetical protein
MFIAGSHGPCGLKEAERFYRDAPNGSANFGKYPLFDRAARLKPGLS